MVSLRRTQGRARHDRKLLNCKEREATQPCLSFSISLRPAAINGAARQRKAKESNMTSQAACAKTWYCRNFSTTEATCSPTFLRPVYTADSGSPTAFRTDGGRLERSACKNRSAHVFKASKHNKSGTSKLNADCWRIERRIHLATDEQTKGQPEACKRLRRQTVQRGPRTTCFVIARPCHTDVRTQMAGERLVYLLQPAHTKLSSLKGCWDRKGQSPKLLRG